VEAINYHLELTPAQLKTTHAALRRLLDDLGDDEPQVRKLIAAVLAKLPDEEAISAIRLDREVDPVEPEPPSPANGPTAA
jgi:hypothetical protein